LSRASATSTCRFSITSRAVMCSWMDWVAGRLKGGIIRGEHPKRRWKGEYPVDLLIVLIIWNRIRGSARDQPFWFLSTWNRIH
jgi:hypothetical protein